MGLQTRSVIIIFIVIALLSFFAGYTTGAYQATHYLLGNAITALESRGYDIDLTAKDLATAIKIYETQFGYVVNNNWSEALDLNNLPRT